MTKRDALPYKIALVINATERDSTDVALIIDGNIALNKTATKAQELPQLIELTLVEHKILPASIDAIVLIKKPGSVTAIRIGTAVANTLAWFNKAHIIEIESQTIDQAIDSYLLGKYRQAVKFSLPSD